MFPSIFSFFTFHFSHFSSSFLPICLSLFYLKAQAEERAAVLRAQLEERKKAILQRINQEGKEKLEKVLYIFCPLIESSVTFYVVLDVFYCVLVVDYFN